MKRQHLLLAAALAACGGPNSSSGDDSIDPDAHMGSDHGDDATTAHEIKSGNLTIQSNKYRVGMTDVEQGYSTGTFYRIPPVMGMDSNGCMSQTYGACVVQSCVFSQPTTDGGLAIRYTNAGPLTVHGVQVNNGSMTMTPGAYGYITVSGAVALFRGGDTVRFVASGNPDGAPAFDVSLVAPSAVQVTSPAFVQGKVTVLGSQNLAVAWTGSSASDVTVQLTAGSTGSSVTARCTYAGNAGSGVVPAAAVNAVQAQGGYASIIVSSESRQTKNPDGWDIVFSLQSYGVITSGLAVGTLQFQ